MNSGPADHLAGQTFQCPEDGSLSNIQVYSIAVSHPGKLTLTHTNLISKEKAGVKFFRLQRSK